MVVDHRQAATRTLWGIAESNEDHLLTPEQLQAARGQGEDAVVVEALKSLIQINPQRGLRLDLMDGRVTTVPGDPDLVRDGWRFDVNAVGR